MQGRKSKYENNVQCHTIYMSSTDFVTPTKQHYAFLLPEESLNKLQCQVYGVTIIGFRIVNRIYWTALHTVCDSLNNSVLQTNTHPQ
jgi:hypothetical protein